MIDTSVHIIQAATTPRPPLPQESDELDFALPSRVRRDLGSFVSAVHHEMTFLKESGGSQKKITNGVRIQVQCNVIAYDFDSESELYLAEDAPVTVHAGGTDSEGTVLACEEFHLLLLLKQDIGESVPVAYISASPWKLLESLNKRLVRMNPGEHPLAVKLLQEGPALATSLPIQEVDTGQRSAARPPWAS